MLQLDALPEPKPDPVSPDLLAEQSPDRDLRATNIVGLLLTVLLLL